MKPDDHRIEEAKAMPIADVVARLELSNLVRTGGELVGPCPQCGGRDRFGINLQSGMFQCRKECGPQAKGDQIALVQHVMGMDFRAALEWLCGPAQGISDAERQERRRKAEENRRRQDAKAQKMRESSISGARDIWFKAQPAEGTPVRDYLTLRGIDPMLYPTLPQVIRFDPQARYTIPVEGEAGKWRTIHTGPAMVCAVVDAAYRVTAVHRTWLDLSQPKGKLILPDPRREGETLPAKKVLGSKKGGAIRFATPKDCDTMIMAEGVETTLSALIAETVPGASAHWCGVDLGNMAGRAQRGPGLKYAGLPDMDDSEAWLPPPWVRRLIFVQDGDSDPKLTRARLETGLRRAMLKRPGLRGSIVHAGEGRDLNDILMGKTYFDAQP
ncbi:DUF7146 domain-containing protein [Paracoccus laeviglucosivorans]|uniref:DUF7146 domain-containing protein n=1 Tax=Paracoccus laeviglucosivorans TaxID=1197861 RepID=A0A521E5I2_9RHOB|nr:hypothetical protein [Paracoccus laeviglucosivorans]SMO79167.1 hypothetical protein SAMN06265221_11167 [Paracoccus laeviglucosivorans]